VCIVGSDVSIGVAEIAHIHNKMKIKIEVSREGIKRNDYISDVHMNSLSREELINYFGLIVEGLLEIVDRTPYSYSQIENNELN